MLVVFVIYAAFVWKLSNHLNFNVFVQGLTAIEDRGHVLCNVFLNL